MVSPGQCRQAASQAAIATIKSSGPGDIIHDRMTVTVPTVDAKSELSSVHYRLQTETPHGGMAKRGFTQTQVRKHIGTSWTRSPTRAGVACSILIRSVPLQALVGRRNARLRTPLTRSD
jgi:hypothetical protein